MSGLKSFLSRQLLRRGMKDAANPSHFYKSVSDKREFGFSKKNLKEKPRVGCYE